MVRSFAFTVKTLGLSSALCLLFLTSPSYATKPGQLSRQAMGIHVDCRGIHGCASWLTTNFAGKRPLMIVANGQSIASIAPLARRSDRAPTSDIEQDSGSGITGPDTSSDNAQTDGGSIAADNDNGHGNDPGHVDESNPGNSSENQNAGVADAGNAGQQDDNGHGNDPGHTDDSNPGQGGPDHQTGGSPDTGQGNGNPSGNTHDDNGHGNDPGKSDSSNPGKGKDK